MYRCVLVGLLLTFYFYRDSRRATAAPPCPALAFFSSWIVLFDTSGRVSVPSGYRKQRVHEVWWLVSGAFSDFFFLFYAELDLFLGGDWIGE